MRRRHVIEIKSCRTLQGVVAIKLKQIEEYRGPEFFIIPEVKESMVGPPAERFVRLAAFLFGGTARISEL